MLPAPIRITAPAKINLYLAIGATRPDGYHSVTTVLHALEFGDELTMRPAAALSLSCSTDLGIPAEENLAFRAARAFGDAVGHSPDVAIELTKRVPHGAGLGGGSSDAAAVIAGLAYLWDIPHSDPRLARVGASLGTDVPFFLTGGAAIFNARGDNFVRSLPARSLPVALVRPAQPVSTAAAYAAFDALEHPAAPGPRYVVDAMHFNEPDALGAVLYNNMTDAAVGLVPAIADALALCTSARGVHGAALCGSGSAVFALCHSDAAAKDVVGAATERGWWSVSTRTSGAGVAVQTVEEGS